MGNPTIARLVARWLTENGSLDASFLFVVGGGDFANVTELFPTVAKQLARSTPELVLGIERVILETWEVGTQSIEEHFHKFIMQPLSTLDKPYRMASTKVIVIDGLDECVGDDDIRLIIRLIQNLP